MNDLSRYDWCSDIDMILSMLHFREEQIEVGSFEKCFSYLEFERLNRGFWRDAEYERRVRLLGDLNRAGIISSVVYDEQISLFQAMDFYYDYLYYKDVFKVRCLTQHIQKASGYKSKAPVLLLLEVDRFGDSYIRSLCMNGDLSSKIFNFLSSCCSPDFNMFVVILDVGSKVTCREDFLSVKCAVECEYNTMTFYDPFEGLKMFLDKCSVAINSENCEIN